uniref:Uncharacterized protein n=1 Tax=Sinocyclocheilus anshuiensis TaxID=1608454 RepID=A0A671QAJ4_9TELE
CHIQLTLRLHSSSLSVLFTCTSTMIPRNRPSEGQRILSRAKRGWVWNQMFVLEEFSGPDPILVGRVSSLIVG